MLVSTSVALPALIFPVPTLLAHIVYFLFLVHVWDSLHFPKQWKTNGKEITSFFHFSEMKGSPEGVIMAGVAVRKERWHHTA